MNINYQYTGKYTDWDGAKNSRQNSVELVNLSMNKKIFGNTLTFNINNLLDKNYEKPATYGRDGRSVKVSFKKTY